MRNDKGQFIKGHLPIITETGKKKMKENASRFWLGKKRPSIIGRTGKKGYKHTSEALKKIKQARRKQNLNGENSWFWKGGITPKNRIIRESYKYADWRKAVFERDNYTCILCGVIGGKLNADHIKQFSLFPELHFALYNGRTLCIDCHKKTDTFGGKSNRKICV